MEQIVKPARKLTGTVTVPGELGPTVLSVAFAAVADGMSTIRNTPPSVEPLVEVLRKLGVTIEASDGQLTVQGYDDREHSPFVYLPELHVTTLLRHHTTSTLLQGSGNITAREDGKAHLRR